MAPRAWPAATPEPTRTGVRVRAAVEQGSRPVTVGGSHPDHPAGASRRAGLVVAGPAIRLGLILLVAVVALGITGQARADQPPAPVAVPPASTSGTPPPAITDPTTPPSPAIPAPPPIMPPAPSAAPPPVPTPPAPPPLTQPAPPAPPPPPLPTPPVLQPVTPTALFAESTTTETIVQ